MIRVKKLDGSLQKYDPEKLQSSLLRAGADEAIIDKIMASVEKKLYDGIETKELFKFVFLEFKKQQPAIAPKYDLKNAILRLGEQGFPFEKLVAKIFQKKGYATKLNQIIRGMYYARFLDVKDTFTQALLVTNTKFSTQVLDYAKGTGLQLMGWRYPYDNGLESNIEKFRLYPVTMLASLDKEKVDMLLRENLFLIGDLCRKDEKELSVMLRISKSKAIAILEEARSLCRRNGTAP
ncbi:hypothetical protein J4453_03620 [Candidatus Woesearchaeota archaeon]|nr:hypothetical protein [Candidatus Woesearchaeota archaeon]